MSNTEKDYKNRAKEFASRQESLGNQCGFCTILETGTTEYWKQMHGDIPHTVNIPGIADQFKVLQDIVPLAKYGGHLLILPKHHSLSLAQVEDQEGLRLSTEAVTTGLHQFFPNNPIFVFEHGAGFIEDEPIACGGCHMDHAHGHFLVLPENSELKPIQKEMELILKKNTWKDVHLDAVPSENIFTDSTKIAGWQPYLSIGMIHPDGDTQSFTYVQKSKEFEIQSQLLRGVVADVIFGQKDVAYWHWRDIMEGFSTEERIQELQRDVIAFRTKTGF